MPHFYRAIAFVLLTIALLLCSDHRMRRDHDLRMSMQLADQIVTGLEHVGRMSQMGDAIDNILFDYRMSNEMLVNEWGETLPQYQSVDLPARTVSLFDGTDQALHEHIGNWRLHLFELKRPIMPLLAADRAPLEVNEAVAAVITTSKSLIDALWEVEADEGQHKFVCRDLYALHSDRLYSGPFEAFERLWTSQQSRIGLADYYAVQHAHYVVAKTFDEMCGKEFVEPMPIHLEY